VHLNDLSSETQRVSEPGYLESQSHFDHVNAYSDDSSRGNGEAMEQSFSLANLRAIWDFQTRKGDKLLRFYPGVAEAFDRRRDARQNLRELRAGHGSNWGHRDEELAERAKGAREEAENALSTALANTSERLIHSVDDRTFRWGLHKRSTINGRTIYGIANTAEAFFADRQLQRIIGSFVEHKPASRQSIVGGLGRTLDSRLPKLLIRCDIERFYDNVDHGILRSRLRREALSPTFRGLVFALLEETAQFTGVNRGLPTGVGLSAKLAEYYLKDLDEALKIEPRILFYARYVDDIVIVFGEREHNELDQAKVLTRIKTLVAEHKLLLSQAKTFTRRTNTQGSIPQFNFLGYEFSSQPRLQVQLTGTRRAEIKRRIDRIFEVWAKADPNNHGHRRLLLDRIRYLTGNTRLANNKRNAMIGIYFSNPHITDPASLTELDDHLRARVAAASLPTELREKVEAISFRDGFEGRRIYAFSALQRKKVRGAWVA
jgi:hypothetical protein